MQRHKWNMRILLKANRCNRTMTQQYIMSSFLVDWLTSCISSTEMYASVGRPRSLGFTSMMTNTWLKKKTSHLLKDKENEGEKKGKQMNKKCNWLTELVQYRLMSSLMAISFLCNLGPVWYHPTILSLAEISKDNSYKIMWPLVQKVVVFIKSSPLTFLNMPYMFSK